VEVNVVHADVFEGHEKRRRTMTICTGGHLREESFSAWSGNNIASALSTYSLMM
jgi:hypothetical protein